MPLAAKCTKIISTVAGGRKRSQAVAGGEHPPDLHTLQPDTADNPWKNPLSIYSTSIHIPTPLSFRKINSSTPLFEHPNKKRSTATRQTASKNSALHLKAPPAPPAHTKVANP